MVEYIVQWIVEVDILGVIFSWWKIMGDIKSLPPAWSKKSRVQQNGSLYPVCTFHINSPESTL